MKIFVNVESRQLQTAVGDSRQVSTLAFKRGDGASVEIIFVRDGVQVELTTGSIVTFGAKLSGKYDANALVLENGFALSGSGSTASYIGAPSFNTVDLDAALEKDGDDTNDVPYLDLMGEISWTDGPDGPPTSTDTFTVHVANDVLRGDEGMPTQAAFPIGTSIPSNGSIQISGTLTSDGTTAVTFPEMAYSGDSGGKPAYASGSKSCQYIEPEWILTSESPAAQWKSSEDVATPDLVTSWTPQTTPGVGTATGSPNITRTAPDSAPPFFYVNDGFLYVQDAGYWKSTPLTL